MCLEIHTLCFTVTRWKYRCLPMLLYTGIYSARYLPIWYHLRLMMKEINVQRAIHTQLNWAILLCDVIPNEETELTAQFWQAIAQASELSFPVVFQTESCAIHSGNPTVSPVYLFLSTIVTRTRRNTEMTKNLTNLMGNLCCAREHSVQYFVQFFYTVKLQSLIWVMWGPYKRLRSFHDKLMGGRYWCLNCLPNLVETMLIFTITNLNSRRLQVKTQLHLTFKNRASYI
jgi:hypothetical protein